MQKFVKSVQLWHFGAWQAQNDEELRKTQRQDANKKDFINSSFCTLLYLNPKLFWDYFFLCKE